MSLFEGHLEVQKTARFARLGTPGPTTREIWLVCHGYRQLAARFIQRFDGIAGDHRVVVAPEALSRFYIDPPSGRHGAESRIGASWMTRADRTNEIRDYVRYLDRLVGRTIEACGGSTSRVVGLGFSQGAHTVTRWSAYGETNVAEVVLWGAYFPVDVEPGEGNLLRAGLTLVYGNEDPTLDAALGHSQSERLAAAGIEPRRLEYDGGHRVMPDALDRLVSTLSG